MKKLSITFASIVISASMFIAINSHAASVSTSALGGTLSEACANASNQLQSTNPSVTNIVVVSSGKINWSPYVTSFFCNVSGTV